MDSKDLINYINFSKHDWYLICSNEKIPMELLREFREYLNWDAICGSSNYDFNDVNFVREFEEYIDWTTIMKRGDVLTRRKSQYKEEFNLVKVQGFTWYGTRKIVWCKLVGSKR